jgi:hypothetical protein
MHSVITDDMRALIGRTLETRVSFPVDRSDIRRWAIAAYYPEEPPSRYWDEGAADARGPLVAPLDFNPFAWMAASRVGPGVEPIDADPGTVRVGASEHLLGAMPPALFNGLNGGIEVEYGPARIRPGDVITNTASISEYREREGRLGLMLFTTTDNHWVNQHGEHVKTLRMTLIRY